MEFYPVAIFAAGSSGFFELLALPNLQQLRFPFVRRPKGGQASSDDLFLLKQGALFQLQSPDH